MHPAIESEAERHIREGNRRLVGNLARRLDVKKEILDSRPYPKFLWHWTEAEFIAFLDEHRFPANTYKDRLKTRRHVVRDALSEGKFVPMEVLNEQGMDAVINDAVMAVNAHYSWLRLNERAAESRRKFEATIGYSNAPLDVFLGRVRELLTVALRQGFPNEKQTLLAPMATWGYELLKLAYMEGTPARSGRFGSYGDARNPAIRISYPGSAISLFDLDWTYAEPQIMKILEAGEATIDQVWFLTGTCWVPTSKATVDVIRSPEREAL